MEQLVFVAAMMSWTNVRAQAPCLVRRRPLRIVRPPETSDPRQIIGLGGKNAVITHMGVSDEFFC